MYSKSIESSVSRTKERKVTMNEVLFDYSALKGRIKEKYDTYESLVPHLSYGMSSLSSKLNNHARFSQTDMLDLADLLDIKDEEFSKYFFTVKVRKIEQDKQEA